MVFDRVPPPLFSRAWFTCNMAWGIRTLIPPNQGTSQAPTHGLPRNSVANALAGSQQGMAQKTGAKMEPW